MADDTEFSLRYLRKQWLVGNAMTLNIKLATTDIEASLHTLSSKEIDTLMTIEESDDEQRARQLYREHLIRLADEQIDAAVKRRDMEAASSIENNLQISIKIGDALADFAYRPPDAYWFEMLMPSKAGKDFLVNLDDLFEGDCDRYGLARARWLHKTQCMKMVAHHWFGVITDTFQTLRKVIW